MRQDFPAQPPLVCPRCRTRSEKGRDMHTLSVAARYREETLGDTVHIVEGLLACDNAACRATYPIVGGVPIITRDPAALLRAEAAAIVEGPLSPEIEAALAEAGPDDAPLARLCEHLSIYIDAHWGDRAEPPPDTPPPFTHRIDRFGLRAIADCIADRAASPVERAVDLGCSVGRGLAELARGARLAIGVDLHFGAVRRARQILAGRPLRYARRVTGRHYRPAVAEAGDRACDHVAFVCADALDPPLVPGFFDRVSAINVFDSVADPAALLSVADGLLAPGGELLLASPYAFQSGIVSEDARVGGADPGAWLRSRLERGDGLEARYDIEDERNLPWSLRRDSRSVQLYSVHWLRARKASPLASAG